MKGSSLKILSAVLLFTVSVSLFAQETGEKKMDKMWGDAGKQNGVASNAEWFAKARYAMFIHWGLYSQSANRWKGQTFYGIGEWLMYLSKARIDEYEAKAKEFNPAKFNAREWVKLAKDAGMKYIVITAKHHEGFAMFKSSNPYNIVDATPFKRDPMKELAEACKEAGLGLGFYYSQFQDWHEINDWSTDLKKTSFEDYFNNKCVPQVKELLSNYGPLKLIWFDTPGEMTKEQSLELVHLVKTIQPQALINSRIGNGVGDYSTYGDHEIPPRNVEGLWEAVNTSNDSWGHAWYDDNWKGPSEIAKDLVSVAARGGNFMLNVGPTKEGIIPAENASFLRQAGKWITKHGGAIYSTQASPWLNALPWGDVTLSGNNLNLFVFDWRAGEEIWLPGLKTNIKSVTIKTTSEKLVFKKDADNWLHIKLPLRKANELIEVITVELAGKPVVNATLGISPVGTTTIFSDFGTTSGCVKDKSSWMEKFGEWKHKTDIRNWKTDTSNASWTINIKTPGQYFVNIEYNAWKDEGGGEWDLVTADETKLRMYTTETTGALSTDEGRQRFRNVRMGVINFKKAGEQVIKLSPAATPKVGGMQLHALYLSPVE